jgi:cold shock CspA family protein
VLVAAVVVPIVQLSVSPVEVLADSPGTFEDDFETEDYTGDTGSLSWTGPWVEQDDDGVDPGDGSARVVDSKECASGFCLELGRQDQDASIWRQANLSGAASATLSFTYQRHGHGSQQGYVELMVADASGSWALLDTFWFSVEDSAQVPASYTIPNSHIAANARIGFFLSNSSSDDSHMNVDNVVLTAAGSPNQPPMLAPIGDRTADEGDTVAFTASASDPDSGDSLSYSLAGSPPSGSAIHPTSGAFSWDTDEAEGPGSHSFVVVVSDDGEPVLSDSETITITIDEVNAAPVLTSPGNQTDAEDDTVSLPLEAEDSDEPANALSWSANGLPPGLSIDVGTGTISGQVGSTASLGSPYTVEVTVTDGGSPVLTDEATFTWTILKTNKPPTLSPIGNRVVNEGSTVLFTASGSDRDIGDTLAYSLVGAPFGASINPTSGAFSWPTTENHGPGTYGFAVVVSDNGSPVLSDVERITVTIHETNTSPSLISPGDQSHAEGDAVSIALYASDVDSPANTFTWSVSTLPPGLSIDPGTGIISGVVAETGSLGSPYLVAITVTDDGAPNLQDSVVIGWTIKPGSGNGAPSGSDAEVTTEPNVSVAIELTGFDPDGDPLSMIITADPDFGELEGTWPSLNYVPDEDISGVDSFTYVLSDGLATSDPHTVRIVVAGDDENLAPVATDDEFWGAAGTLIVGGVLHNDFDVEESALVAALAGGPEHGTLVLNADGSFEYLPDDGFAGIDGFTYQISDDIGLEATATVTLTIEAAAPTAPPADRTPPPDTPASASSATRQSVVSVLTAADNEQARPSEQNGNLSRTLVLLSRAGGSSVANVGLPMIALVLTAIVIALFGRISLVPLLRRGEPGTGTVSMYDPERGFGLVSRDTDGAELFVHRSALSRRLRARLRPGDRVRYRAVVGSVRDLVTWARPDASQS